MDHGEPHSPDGTDDLTYPEVGATAAPELPAGYQHLDLAQTIGHGADGFARARARLFGWDMHRGAGLDVPADAVVELGETVTLRLSLGPFGISAPVRVIAVEDEPRVASFTYGTLAGHPECGEERFTVTLASDGVVRARIRAFSRPVGRLARLGGPLTRQTQLLITRRYLAALVDDRPRSAAP
ncbi:MAG: DUF1990 domain-containing protein [Propionibacteriales bacterium]|nr:DUF1990 domain-containing protein [Propionibacteriales bacterium]